jgi:hypothetical protein
MGIGERIRQLFYGRGIGVYQCWMCGMVHNNPVAYLWHINACELERTGKPTALLQEYGPIRMVSASTKQ